MFSLEVTTSTTFNNIISSYGASIIRDHSDPLVSTGFYYAGYLTAQMPLEIDSVFLISRISYSLQVSYEFSSPVSNNDYEMGPQYLSMY